ncbi:hypothetical protein [Bradyrhizobium retamae]|nr:hypothetical protein [Bradyrhizobium retamae]
MIEHQAALARIAYLEDLVTMLQKPMGTGEYILRVALDHFWKALGAEHQTDACGRLRNLLEERNVLNAIRDALEERGFFHMANGRDIGKLLDDADALKRALVLAVDMLAANEPGDSRAVSNEFVALAAVSTGDTSPEVMAIIDQPRSPAAFRCAPTNLEITVS